MALDPAAAELIQTVSALDLPPLSELPVEEVRAISAQMAAMVGGEREAVGSVEELTVSVAGVELAARRYRPAGADGAALVWFPGGGFVTGGLDSHDGVCRRLANTGHVDVVCVTPRLAPEHPFPVPLTDCLGAVGWAYDHAADLGLDPGRIAIGGDSAGGNLAAATTLLARDHGGPPLRFQLLVYPALDPACASPSFAEFGDGYLLDRDTMHWYWQQYLGGADGRHPLASPPLANDLSGLPPALVITAECDPLRDEGEAYAAALRRAGVDARSVRYEGLVHGFFQLAPLLPRASLAVAEVGATLRQTLRRAGKPGEVKPPPSANETG